MPDGAFAKIADVLAAASASCSPDRGERAGAGVKITGSGQRATLSALLRDG